jgi:hypothetical protein
MASKEPQAMPPISPCFLGLALFAQVAAGPTEPMERKQQLAKFAADAARFELTLQSPMPVRLDLQTESVLNWEGSAFVWLREGRPEAIGAFWNRTNPRTSRIEYGHAFHSLSDYAITAHVDSKLIWAPKTPGLQFRPVADAPAVAADSRRRLTQLRAMAQEFSAVQWKGSRSQLRMLTQPLIRYEPAKGVARDGAIFAFTNTEFGTDPDALLLLEARESDGKLRWEFAFARLHYGELSGHHGEREVWRVEDTWQQRKLHVYGEDPGRESTYYSVLR